MMSLSEILFLSFFVSAWTAPTITDIDASSESMEFPEPTQLDDITINDQKISVTRSPQPIVEILDPYHRGIPEIHRIADKSYQKLLAKTPLVNFRYAPYFVFRRIPVSDSQSTVSPPISQNPTSSNNDVWNKLRNCLNLLLNKIQSVATLEPQIDPLPIFSSTNQPSNNQSVWKLLQDSFDRLTNINKNKHNGNRTAREVMKNVENLVFPQIIQEFISAFTNQDSVEGTTASPELSDESSESDENQSGSTMTMSATEELLTTTALPTEFESTTTTTFETTTEIPTTKSNEEEIIPSTTQSELLDKNAEIDEAVAFNIDGGDISSTQESATQFPKINKDNFYVIYGGPTLTKKDNSLLLNANVGMAPWL